MCVCVCAQAYVFVWRIHICLSELWHNFLPACWYAGAHQEVFWSRWVSDFIDDAYDLWMGHLWASPSIHCAQSCVSPDMSLSHAHTWGHTALLTLMLQWKTPSTWGFISYESDRCAFNEPSKNTLCVETSTNEISICWNIVTRDRRELISINLL